MAVPWRGMLVVAGLCLACYIQLGQGASGPYDWMGYDRFDEITDRYDAVNADNCRSKPTSALRLPMDTLAQLPRFNKLLSTIIYPNRTKLLHIHNMALNRAFFFSYIYQKLNYSEMFYDQPGLMYYYFSAAADITANEYNINSSAMIFDTNCSYPNWYRNLPFNQTLELFGPRAWRYDNYNEPTNWLREPTNNTVDIHDYGAGPQHNYTSEAYKINQWYDLWLPDGWDMQGLDSVRKYSYDIGIKYSNETGKFATDEWSAKVFFGPPSPGQKEEEHLPVVFTQPYFDCGRSNRWLVAAASPVVDQLPRYLDWFHLRRHRFVASSVMEMEFLAIDINPCPLGTGNQPPNYFHNTARCKDSTMCEPIYGWGFRRGGYLCVCKPGYRYPPWQSGPYRGIEIESATEDEYKNGFSCIRVELQYVIPLIRGNETTGRNSIGGTALDPDQNAPTRRRREAPKPEVHMIEEKLPNFVRRTLRSAPANLEPSASQIQNKKIRLLRSLNLQEVTDAAGQISVVPLQSRPQPVAHAEVRKKRSLVARYQHSHLDHRDAHAQSKSHSRKKRATSDVDDKAYERMMEIFAQKESVDKNNCQQKRPEELELPGDVAYGAEEIFSPQARTALRLSHFLSNFLQNIDMYEEYGNLRGDKLLNIELIFGEVISNVMGDLEIKGSGVFYDVDKFKGPDGKTRQFFGPYAYRYEKEDIGGPDADRANTHFRAIDYAGFPTHYLDEPWFKNVKERWQSNTYGLVKYTQRPMIRSDLAGTSLKKFELYPMYYYAPKEGDGWWSAPYFDCDGYVNEWIITYSVPFFGLNSIGSGIEFKGVVVVDVKLDELDINQCPMDFHVPNAFKNTARCHFETTYCYYIPSQRFKRGAYKCECLQGYEYPYEDRAWYYDGQTLEDEYNKMKQGLPNRYHTLNCRISGADYIKFSWSLLLVVALATWL